MNSQLSRGLTALGLDLPATAHERLEAYASLLGKWNRVYNLTALRDETQIVTHHLLDSLAVLSNLDCAELADIGSGGGLPGIPLAIAAPELEIVLVETSHKKATFLQQAKIELKLDNLEVIKERVENWRPAALRQALISRAFSELADFVGLTNHLVASDGRWFAMKGVHPDDEIARLPQGVVVDRVIPLDVPELGAARHLVVLRRS